MKSLKQQAAAAFHEVLTGSAEAGRLIKQLVERIAVYPVRLCDGGGIQQRARLTLNLVSLVPAGADMPGLTECLTTELEVNLFDPPQREKFREEVVSRLAALPHKTHEIIGRELGLTKTAVGRAVKLHRRMLELGLIEAYVVMSGPPNDFERCKVHRHLRYQFDPLERFEDESMPVNDGSDADGATGVVATDVGGLQAPSLDDAAPPTSEDEVHRARPAA